MSGTVDLRAVVDGLRIARRARQIDALRSNLTALGLPFALVELMIANEIVNREPLPVTSVT